MKPVLLFGGAEGPEGSFLCSAFFVVALFAMARKIPVSKGGQ